MHTRESCLKLEGAMDFALQVSNIITSSGEILSTDVCKELYDLAMKYQPGAAASTHEQKDLGRPKNDRNKTLSCQCVVYEFKCDLCTNILPSENTSEMIIN